MSVSAISPELTNQWPLDTVLVWLAQNQFSKQWQDAFRALNLQGATFLELGSRHAGRGNLGMMHKQVYPRLAQECITSGIPWEQQKEREEGKRMRRLIRNIVSGLPVDPSQTVSSHSRKDSAGGSHTHSAGTDLSDSPNVSFVLLAIFYFIFWRLPEPMGNR